MLTDIPGVSVGHAQRTTDGWRTGVTAVIPPPGTVGAVDVRGGGPGTHETDALAPGTLVDTVDAVALCGGSAYGLIAAHGVQRWCEEHGRGFTVGAHPSGDPLVVPIVPAAAIFDLGRGHDVRTRPDEAMGYAAAAAASTGPFARGYVGAGTGARSQAGTGPGGIGTATVHLGAGVVVAALVVVNAAGAVYDESGQVMAQPGPGQADPAQPGTSQPAPLNTTLAVVATTARLDVAAATRMAGAGHDGLARAIRPVHTVTDGDTVFALATGLQAASAAVAHPHETHSSLTRWPGAADVLGLAAVQAAAADAVAEAVRDAVRHHRPTHAG